MDDRGAVGVGTRPRRAVELAVVLTILGCLLLAGVVPFLLQQREHARDAVIQAEVRRAGVVLLASHDAGAPPDSLGALVAAGFTPAPVVDTAGAEVHVDPPCVALGHAGSARTWRWTAEGVTEGRCTDRTWLRVGQGGAATPPGGGTDQ